MSNEKVLNVSDIESRFTKMPSKVFREGSELKTTDIAVLACICSFADNETNTAFPRVKKIAEVINSSPRTVHRSLRVLENVHIITKVRRTNKDGGSISSLYQINYF